MDRLEVFESSHSLLLLRIVPYCDRCRCGLRQEARRTHDARVMLAYVSLEEPHYPPFGLLSFSAVMIAARRPDEASAIVG